jgi:hypothetical protein
MKRVEDVNPAFLRSFLTEVERRLVGSPEDPALLSRRLSLLRSLGELAEAGRTADHLMAITPSHTVAGRLRAILAGKPLVEASVGPVVPFVRLTDVLAEAEHARLWNAVAQSADGGRPAPIISAEGGQQVDPAQRDASVHRLPQGLRAWFGDRLRRLLDEKSVLDRIGMGGVTLGEVEVALTRYVDDGRFVVHRDDAPPTRSRRVTFVYYLHRRPKPFQGGDLLLFDDPDPARPDAPLEFTRILPDDNSLIIFPSNRLHAVSRMRLRSDDPLDGRWTVNGWLHGVGVGPR